MNRFESPPIIAAGDLGLRQVRLARTSEPRLHTPDKLMANDSKAGIGREIDRAHGLGKLTITDILLDVGISPYKPWPTTKAFRNID